MNNKPGIPKWGDFYMDIARILELDRQKTEIIGRLMSVICQQCGTSALPPGISEEVEAVVRESNRIREGM